MPSIRKTSGKNVVLDTSEFSGGSGIIDENSITVQKAFKDINDRLDLVDQTYDGLMSSTDKIKLDSSTSVNTPSTIVMRDSNYSFKISSIDFDDHKVNWSNDHQTLEVQMNPLVTQQIGLENYFRVKASSNITNGQLVMATGSLGNSGIITAKPAENVIDSQFILGIATQDILQGEDGFVTCFGLVSGINTTGGIESWVDGQKLYYDPTGIGKLTKNLPSNGSKVTVAMVIHAHSNGSLFVRLSHGYGLENLHNVTISNPTEGQTLKYTNGQWINVNAISEDAPSDGKPYIRKNGQWVELTIGV